MSHEMFWSHWLLSWSQRKVKNKWKTQTCSFIYVQSYIGRVIYKSITEHQVGLPRNLSPLGVQDTYNLHF